MKRSLSEQLERIHRLNYGKQTINEGFVDNILKGLGFKKETKKVDDPKKADLVGSDVEEFFTTLEDAKESGGLSQQQRGGMEYQKGVESMQIGLMLLGYDLPKFGVDGLFGPETAEAVTKFTKDKLGGESPLNESVKLVAQGGGLIGKPGHGTHNAIDWESKNAWDVTAPVGTEVYSLTNGVVSKLKKDRGAGVTKDGVKKIYGDQLSVKSTDGNPDVFYTHIESPLNQGDEIKKGDVVGTIMQAGGITPHVHIGLSSGNLSDLATGLSNATGSSTAPLVKATPEMLNKLIELLKERGVTSEDLKKLIDVVTTGGSAEFTDLDLTKQEDVKKYAEICQRFIESRQPNLLNITGEMMAKAAVLAFERYRKYVPAELALAQLAAEGGIGNDNPNSRPIKTKNPFNVGNVDSGEDVYRGSVQEGINAYYLLIARNYLGGGKTARDLVNNFVNKSGNRYASSTNYEKTINILANKANRIAQSIV